MAKHPEVNVIAGGIIVRLALGAFTLRERLKLVWFLFTGTVVTIKGPAVLSVKTLPLENHDASSQS